MEIAYLIAGGIVLLAILISIGIIIHSRKKSRAITHYEKIRDKLTLREPEPEADKVVEEFSSLGDSLTHMVMSLVTLGIVISIGAAIMSEIGEAMNTAEIQTEMISSAAGWIPVILVVGFVAMILSLIMMFIGKAKGASGTTYEEAKSGIEEYKMMRNKLTASKVS